MFYSLSFALDTLFCTHFSVTVSGHLTGTIEAVASVVSTLKCRTRVIPAQAGIQEKLLKHWIEVGAYLPPAWE